MTFPKFKTTLRGLATAAASLFLAVAVTVPAPAHAAGSAKRSDGSAICDFSSFNYDSTANSLTITCGTTAPPSCTTQGVGSFEVQNHSTRAAAGVNATYQVRIVRTGGCQGAVRVVYAQDANLTGYTFNGTRSNGAVDFADGQTFKDVPLVTGSTPGYFLLILVATSPTATFNNTAYWVDVSNTAPPPPPPPPGDTPPAGCTTTATYNQGALIAGAWNTNTPLKMGQSASFTFKTYDLATAANPIRLQPSENINTPNSAWIELRVAACPGDFTPTNPNCGFVTDWHGASLNVAVSSSSSPIPTCVVDSNKTYYYNLRFVNDPHTNQPSCNLTDGCVVNNNIQNYNPPS